MRNICLFVLLGFVFFLHLPGFAQANFRHLTTSEGLSHNTVQDLVQDRKGFLWFATSDGLNRYDGLNFQIFRRSLHDKRSMSSNEVTCLLEDKKGRIWIGTRSGGICQLDSSGYHFIHLKKTNQGADISAAVITSLAEDESGNLWAATHGLGLLLINPDTKKVQQFNTKRNNLPNDHVLRVTPDQKGNLWIGFTSGILVKMNLADHSMKHYQFERYNHISKGNITSIFCDAHGRVWVGTEGWGLFRYEESKDDFTSVYYKSQVVEGTNIVRSIYQDKTGKLWLGTDDGVIVSDDVSFNKIKHYKAETAVPGSLSTHATYCIRGDRQGNIWVGTWEGGLNILYAKPGLFDQYQHQPGQSNSLLTPHVSAVSADQEGNVWLGSRHGLSRLNRRTNTYTHFQHREGDPTSLSGNDVTNIRQITRNRMLVNIWNNGTDLVDSQTGKVLKHLTQFNADRLLSIIPIDSGNVYIATNKGALWRMDLHTWQTRRVESFPATKLSFTAMTAGPDSTIWIGSYDEGLIAWNQRTGRVDSFHNTLQTGGLYDAHITCLFLDRKKQLWVGTQGGLHRYDAVRKQFDLISIENGLPNDAIMSIVQDKTGFLWIATNSGLCQISEAGKVIRTYRQEDGLAGNDFTERAVSQSPDGTLFWGGKHGLTVFNPGKANFSSPGFPVYLTGMKLFNRPVLPGDRDSPLTRDLSETKSVTLRYNQSVVTFDFAAVLFQAHRNVRYAYKLEGFEEAWNYVGPQRSATYTNLDPGTYQLLVKASVSDDFKNASQTRLQIVVLPPWYRTFWAYLLYAVLVAALLLLTRWMIQIREGYKTELRIEHIETEKARELDRLRSGFFTNISHEFRTPLTLILTPLEQLLSDNAPDPRRPWFHTMHQNANRLLRLINQLLDLSKLESGLLHPEISRQNVIEFIRGIAASFEQIAVRQQITLQIIAAAEASPVFFDPDIVEKALYNLIANALKNTGAKGTVTVSCRLIDADQQTQLVLEVKDTGSGIPVEDQSHIFERFYQVNGQHQTKKSGTGIGLALTRELIELHKGNISVQSQPGEGSLFTVKLPVYQAAFPQEWLSGKPANVNQDIDRPAVWLETSPHRMGISSQNKDLPLVLIVEDHDDLRIYLSDCFSRDYRVLQASNGREALLQAEKEIPDLIVSDWLMPDMDGVQLCSAIKTNEKTSHVPLILLTSKSSTESKIFGLNVGADDYVTKPFNVDILLTRARNLIQSRLQLRIKYGKILHLKPSEIQIDSVEEQFLKKVLSIIEKQIADPDLDVQHLEGELAMSSTQLYRKLKALTGKGGNELIRSIRLQRAQQYLSKGGQQIAEIAYLVGFNDASYFIRAFKKEYGMSPGEFMKSSLQMDDSAI